jgi:hypothetical protein
MVSTFDRKASGERKRRRRGANHPPRGIRRRGTARFRVAYARGVTATDAAGNARRATRTVKLKR